MGASRKLQGEIDRVLKKVQEGVDVFDSIWNKVYDTENANQKEKFEADLKKEIKKLQRYRDQIKTWIQSSEIKDKKALMDARKQIEREMERFKVCEKETKTKAFSKEGLGQQPKTDPKEKAKAETRDWLNTVVGDLENQIDNFEAEVEGLSIKKGKQRPPRLTHLEKSITRHKAHIKKLESILRLLDNDELSPEQVNDVKDFLEDYVERNQEDFDEFSDVEELYSTLPMEKVEALEDMVSLGPSSLVKGVASVSTTAVLSSKSSMASSPTQAALSSTPSQGTSQDQAEETASQDSNPDSAPQTPPSKSGPFGPSVPLPVPLPAISTAVSAGTAAVSVPGETISSPVRPTVVTTAAAVLSAPATVRSVSESISVGSPTPANSSVLKDDDSMSFPPRRSSPAITEIGLGRGITRGTSQTLGTTPINIGPVPGNGQVGAVPAITDLSKRNILNVDERISSGGLSQQLGSPLGNKILQQQVLRTNDAISSDSTNTNESTALGGRVFSPSVVSGVQWRPQTAATFQSQNEIGQSRGRPEIVPDQREKYLQRLQQVQQLNVSHITGINQKQFPTQQQNPLLQQFNSQSSSVSPQVSLGLGVQGPGITSAATSSQPQQPSILQQSSQHPLISTGQKDSGHTKSEERQQSLADDISVEPAAATGSNKQINEDDAKATFSNTSAAVTEGIQLSRDSDLSSGQPLQPGMSSFSVGVIGRRSASDLGAVGSSHDQAYNMQMLEAAYYKLPQPKDSERVKSYVPRHPAATPASYPQIQAPLVSNPAFWERIGSDTITTDLLFFSFYYQQNTYQQYLAARELKKQSWRYHRKYNTWFQRHVEPQVTTDEFERGSYVYFDFHVTEDGSGWCQRIKNDFTFEYNYLEDELSVQTN